MKKLINICAGALGFILLNNTYAFSVMNHVETEREFVVYHPAPGTTDCMQVPQGGAAEPLDISHENPYIKIRKGWSVNMVEKPTANTKSNIYVWEGETGEPSGYNLCINVRDAKTSSTLPRPIAFYVDETNPLCNIHIYTAIPVNTLYPDVINIIEGCVGQYKLNINDVPVAVRSWALDAFENDCSTPRGLTTVYQATQTVASPMQGKNTCLYVEHRNSKIDESNLPPIINNTSEKCSVTVDESKTSFDKCS